MGQSRTIARILYYVCIALALIYALTFLYSAYCLLSGFAITSYQNDMNLHINFPLTNQPLLNIENNYSYIIFSFLLVLIVYAIFFWLSSRVFSVFLHGRLFTESNIVHLKQFYIYNIFFPLPMAAAASFFVEVKAVIWGLVFIHLMLGVFCLFLSNIFQQGLLLQKDQDLFI